MKTLLQYFYIIFLFFGFSGISNAQCSITGTSVNASFYSSNPCTILSSCNGVIYIGNGTAPTTLLMDNNLDLSCMGAIRFVVRNNATLDFSNGNYDLQLAAGSSIQFDSGSGLTGGSTCSASDRILIGSEKVAACAGGSSVYDFTQIVTQGGYNVVSVNPSFSVVCGSGSTSLTATSIPSTSAIIRWYDAASGGNLLQTGVLGSSNTYTTPIISATTTYYAEATIGTITTPRKAVTVKVNPLPNNTVSSGFTGGSFCLGSQATLTFDADDTNGAPPYTLSFTDGTSTYSQVISTNLPTTFNVAATSSVGYTLNSITNNNGCVNFSPANLTANVTFRQNPTASISGNTVLCINASSPNITFTNPRSAGITVSYTINGGTNQTVTIPANGTSNVAVPTTTAGSFVYALVSVVYTTSPSCTQPLSGSATVTVNQPPAGLSYTSSSPVYCIGNLIATNSASLITVGSPALVYSVSPALPTGLSLNTSTGSITGTPTVAVASSNYTISATNTCGTTTSVINITISPTSIGGNISGSTAVCSGKNSTTLTLNGYTGTIIKWQSSPFNTFASSVNDIANTTSTLIATDLTTTTYYRAVVMSGACSAANSAIASITINTLVTKTWNGSNWLPAGLPTSNDIIEFNGTYTSLGSIEGCSCIANADVTFNSGHTLTLTNELTVANLKNVVFEDGASLVQINNVANSGDIQYKRTTSSRVSDYTYVSSPVYSLVSPQTLGDLVSSAGTFYSYEVTSTDEYWEKRAATDAMDIGKGYIVARNMGIPIGLPPPNQFDLYFYGVPNNGHYELLGIFANKSYLLGNPYPSAINADAFLTANSGVLDGTLYFWTHNTAIQDRDNITDDTAGTGAYAYTSNDYATYNKTGGTAAAPSDSSGNSNSIPNGYIAAGQGFFASSKVTLTDSKIVFNNNMRVASTVLADGTGANQQFFKKRLPKTETVKSIEKNRIWLNLTNAQGAFKQTLVGYITNATNDYDSGFDGESYDGNEFIDFYSINQNKKLTIQGRALPFDTNDEVPLGFKTKIDGIFTINLEQVDGFLTSQDLFLEDKLTNTIVDLKMANYTFNTLAGTFDDRFVLRYTNKTLGTNDFKTTTNKVLVSCKNKQIKINSFDGAIHKLVIYDLLGRPLFQRNKVNSNELVVPNLNFSQQTLVIKATLENGATTTHKIIFQ